ncbi:MAG: DsbA family protein [Patescibacteria group bacterium]|nr:DsbA family protein [Patescibacteria group bacterium]
MADEHKLTKKEKKELRRQEGQEKAEKGERNALYKKVGIIVGVVLVVGLSVVGLVKLAGSSGSSSSSGINVPPVSKNDITKGNPKSKVTLIEYSDFQCPACAAYHPLVKQLLSEFGDKIYFAYRFFPLTSIHKNALISSQAAYAAKLQGKFFEMHDMLFETQTSWAQSDSAADTFVAYAKKLGLDSDKFQKDMNSSEAKNYVTDSQNQALSIGINATPTFFVNGVQIANPRGYDDFKKIIQDALNKK